MVIAISPDSEASHARFIEKYGLTVELLSDPDKKVCNLYGVWRKKKMAGREYMGVVRTTFLVDPDGKSPKCGGRCASTATRMRCSVPAAERYDPP